MKSNEMSQILAQIRAMAIQAQGTESKNTQTEGVDFAHLLKQSIDAVNETQQQASALADAFERGESQVNLSEVMVALQKASISFQAMTEVRNKLVNAYQEIMNMPV